MSSTARGQAVICCVYCGTKVLDNGDTKFCVKCGNKFGDFENQAQNSRQNTPIPSTSSRENGGRSETATSNSYSVVQSQENRRRTMTFNEYKCRKEEHRQSNFRPVTKKKLKREELSNDVTINVGMMTYHEDQNCLRPVWGKNQTVTVARNSTCAAIFEKAITKRKAHDRHFAKLCEQQEYQLLLPDGSSALFLPGSDKREFFNLELYKQDIGKPYNRITLFLCAVADKEQEDINFNNNTSGENETISAVIAEDPFDCFTDAEVPIKSEERYFSTPSIPKPAAGTTDERNGEVRCPTCAAFFPKDIIQGHADLCAENENVRTFIEIMDDADCIKYISNSPPDCVPDEISASVYTTYQSDGERTTKQILKDLTANIVSISRVNVRRGRLFEDYVDTRKKCPWHKPENSLKVTFIGEPAIDTGGPRREFLTEIMRQVNGRLFPGGLPIISATAIAENEFLYAGNLMVASLLQGGPAPRFLSTWVYEYIVSGDQQINSVGVDDIQSEAIKDFVNQLKKCENENEMRVLLSEDSSLDILQGICYRGNPMNANTSDRDKIVRSIIMKEVVQQRIPMLSQFVNGLAVCGMLESIRANPVQMKNLFCMDSTECQLDSDVFGELTEVQFSQEQQKKLWEIDTHKYFCDFVDKLFYQGIDGFGLPDLLKFVTGVSEVSPIGFSSRIKVTFIHGCQKDCQCRPTASTCDLVLRIPVHCNSLESMCELFVSAFQEGIGFGVV